MPLVFIVDDAPDFSIALAKKLEMSGHQVKCMLNGRQALIDVILKVPDLIILDLMMPVMDGLSFLETLRTCLRLHALPVVILSGQEDGPMIDRAREWQVDSILTKGKVTVEDINKSVSRTLTANGKRPVSQRELQKQHRLMQ